MKSIIMGSPLWIRFLIYFLVAMMPFVAGYSAKAETMSLNNTISTEDKAKFDQILQPVIKVYNMMKYSASAIAVIALLFAGIGYMLSGNDIRKRDTSKNMVGYVLAGLVVIWAAPFIVNLLIA